MMTFLTGRGRMLKSALRAGRYYSTKVISPGEQPSHWVLFNALELRNEVERAHLASFLSRLRSMSKERDTPSLSGANSSKAFLGNSLGSDVVLEFGGESDSLAMAPAPIGDGEVVTAAWAYDLLRFFQSGGKLDADELCTLFTLAADQLEEEPTVATLQSGPDGRWTVIGDLHGSLSDLSSALEKTEKLGLDNCIVFNGDFVDRGFQSVEVLATVLALKVALPSCVHLNRGNHEDQGLSFAYDFAAEVARKYGQDRVDEVMTTAGDVFSVLPLAATFNGSLILHGGLPRVADWHQQFSHGGERVMWGLKELNEVKRVRGKFRTVAFARKSAPVTRLDENGLPITGAAHKSGPDASAEEATTLIVQDLLWSDPGDVTDRGVEVPHYERGGAGCLFGGGLVSAFLKRHGLRRLVRSHQVCPNGVAKEILPFPFSLDNEGSPVIDRGPKFELWTVFSASQYPNGKGVNGAAGLELSSGVDSEPVIMSWEGNDDDEDSMDSAAGEMKQKLTDSVTTVYWRHENSLLAAWTERELLERNQPIGQLSADVWSEVLVNVIGMRPEIWLALLPLLGGEVDQKTRASKSGTLVNYRHQARLIANEYQRTLRLGLDSTVNQSGAAGALAAIYSDPVSIEAMFSLLDNDGSGEISFQEVETVVDRLNAENVKGSQPHLNAQSIWEVLDQDRSGSISLNEFAESSRVARR